MISSFCLVAPGCQPQRPVPPTAPPQAPPETPPTPSYGKGGGGGQGAILLAEAVLVAQATEPREGPPGEPGGRIAPPLGAGDPVRPPGAVEPTEPPASIGLPGRPPMEGAALGTALRFLDGLFRGITWRWRTEVDEIAVFSNWDARDGRHPNPLRIGQVMRSRLMVVQIEGRAAWLERSWEDRMASIEIHMRSDRAYAVWPHLRGKLAIPLARSAANRWVVWRMPFRPEERPLPW